jgi:hypothetical protein
MAMIVQRILAVLLSLLFLAGVVVFASLALGVLVAVGLVAWAWLWWRGRHRIAPREPSSGVVVEGEYRDVTPPPSLEKPSHKAD